MSPANVQLMADLFPYWSRQWSSLAQHFQLIRLSRLGWFVTGLGFAFTLTVCWDQGTGEAGRPPRQRAEWERRDPKHWHLCDWVHVFELARRSTSDHLWLISSSFPSSLTLTLSRSLSLFLPSSHSVLVAHLAPVFTIRNRWVAARGTDRAAFSVNTC